MSTTLIFDFETVDPDLVDKGSGFLFGTAKIVGMGYQWLDGLPQYTVDKAYMRHLLESADVLVAHNLSYELGICKYLGIEFKDKTVFCTKVGAYLDNSIRNSTSLESLAEEFGMIKTIDDLLYAANSILKLGHDETLTDRHKLTLKKWVYTNLDKIPSDVVKEYCLNDVRITAFLHSRWMQRVDRECYKMYSEVNKVLVEMRARGVDIDVNKVRDYQERLQDLIDIEEIEINKYALGCNYNSSQQLEAVFEMLDIEIPRNAPTERFPLGSPKIDHVFLESCSHPLAKHIISARKYKKAKNEFLTGLLDLQVRGKIHGTMSLFGAALTGRFSHKNPNLAQIPIRDPVIGPMLRDVFIPERGKIWVSLDLKAQEPRLMAHYANRCHDAKVQYVRPFEKTATVFNVPMIKELIEAYKKDPLLDSHEYNRQLINQSSGLNISKSTAKIIALGKAYGMGLDKLAKSLNLTRADAQKVSRAFNAASPYLQALSDFCQHVFKTKKSIKTLLGRHLRYDGADHKALNKLIQGSAADQLCAMLLALYKEGIIPQVVVHDEINISLHTEEEANKVKEIVEHAVKLDVPVIAVLEKGRSWAEAKGIKQYNTIEENSING